ncbi:Transcriptional repressor SmtB [Anaerolineae bacterium]|nr:Transcriptional repressor SmtB [Anaerolineae bacterium]
MPQDTCEIFYVNKQAVTRVAKQMPASTSVTRAAEVFAALGDPTRLRLVAALARAELCVCDLATLLEMTVSAVSHQLRLLRHLGLVKYRKAGRLVYYSLDDEHPSEILTQVLEHVEHGPTRQIHKRKAR